MIFEFYIRDFALGVLLTLISSAFLWIWWRDNGTEEDAPLKDKRQDRSSPTAKEPWNDPSLVARRQEEILSADEPCVMVFNARTGKMSLRKCQKGELTSLDSENPQFDTMAAEMRAQTGSASKQLKHLFQKWKKQKSNRARKKAFFRKFEEIANPFSTATIWSNDAEFFVCDIVRKAFLNRDHKIMIWLVSSGCTNKAFGARLVSEMKYFCQHSVEHRFFICRGGLIKKICLTWEAVKYPEVCSELYWVVKSLMKCKHTKRRVREVPNFKWIQREMARLGSREEHLSTCSPMMGNYLQQKKDVSFCKEMIERQKSTIVCTGCGKFEPEGEKFKKCSRCKLAYFCSHECLRKNYKQTHKNVCNAVSDS